MLSHAQRQSFHTDGFVILPNFFDLATLVNPIQTGIAQLLQTVAAMHQISLSQAARQDFATAYAEIIAVDRQLGSLVYDKIKRLPQFIQGLAHPGSLDVAQTLCDSQFIGIVQQGFGVRIDNPQETQYMAPWHQEYLSQLHSPDGLIFWSPLVPMTPELGPVELCVGSHQFGILPVKYPDPTRQSAYDLRLANLEPLAHCPTVSPLLQPGDVLIIHFLTAHRSGLNTTEQARWSMQYRYFNFMHPEGQRIAWAGGYNTGASFVEYYPEYLLDAEVSP